MASLVFCFRIQISKDKQSYAKVLQADFLKIKKDELASSAGIKGGRNSLSSMKYLNWRAHENENIDRIRKSR